jgi:hypothetical protein
MRPGGRGPWLARNPRSTRADRQRARAVARAVALEYRRRGAAAVVLGGSWARGDAHRASDLDLWVFGCGHGTDVRWREPFVVVVDRRSAAEERRRLRNPPTVGGSVPGWRTAVPLYDPRGVARRLAAEARRFRWAPIAARCDRWVAGQLVAWAEEAVKLVRALASGDAATAAVQRNLLVDALAFVMAIRRRRFWGSENRSWERIGRSVGGRWATAQRRALGIPSGSLAASCRAALALYSLTAADAAELLRPEQRAIVAHACRVAGQPLPERRGRLRRRSR